MNTNEQNTYDDLEHKYKTAIDLRILGFTYRKISTSPAVNVKEHTVRTWFMSGGKCYEPYKIRVKLAESERKEFFQEIGTQIQDIAVSAVQGLRKAVEKGNLNAIFKSFELSGVDRRSLFKVEAYEDEGIKLLREIIRKRREIVRKK